MINFRNVVKEIDDSTVLIVIGDHGMTETGKVVYYFNISIA